MYTSSYNSLPKLLLAGLSENRRASMRKVYDVGSIVSVLGGIVGIGGALWAAGTVWIAVWDEAKWHAGLAIAAENKAQELVKRVVQAEQTRRTASKSLSGGGLQPLVKRLNRHKTYC